MLGIFLLASVAHAQNLDEQITDTRDKIKQLETDIAGYEKELTSVERQKHTLTNAVKTLDLTSKKLGSESTLTETRIEGATKEISSVSINISDRELKINKHTKEVSKMLRDMATLLEITPVEIALSGKTFATSMDELHGIDALEEAITDRVILLKKEKMGLEGKRDDLLARKLELSRLKKKLGDQNELTLQNKKAKEVLLRETKNKESNYRTLLEQKIVQKAQFEQELRTYESRLRADINFANLPKAGSGVLAWPLDQVFITQYFGDTEFARSNAYNGKGHNGIDFRATLGTAVKSSGRGVVRAVGNTDLGCPGGSYGQWVLIDHGNALSTLYSHLSLIKVNAGQTIELGGLVGYSGSTGYATGPHLHFGVYATEGVKVTKLIRNDGTASKCTEMPVSPPNGYLNPLLYL